MKVDHELTEKEQFLFLSKIDKSSMDELLKTLAVCKWTQSQIKKEIKRRVEGKT